MSQIIIVTCNNSNCDFVGMYHNQTIQSIKQYRKFFSKIKTIGDKCLHRDVTTVKISSEIDWSLYMDRVNSQIVEEKIHKCSHYLLNENKKSYFGELSILRYFLNKAVIIS